MWRALPWLLLLSLGGCAWMGEEAEYAMRHEMLRLRGYDWGQATAQLTGVQELLPTAAQQEAKQEQQICAHQNGRERVVQQEGITDEFNYRHCVLAPYDQTGGQRMSGRGD